MWLVAVRGALPKSGGKKHSTTNITVISDHGEV
jgi:hypothetical protein